jgi:hypothetical protein
VSSAKFAVAVALVVDGDDAAQYKAVDSVIVSGGEKTQHKAEQQTTRQDTYSRTHERLSSSSAAAAAAASTVAGHSPRARWRRGWTSADSLCELFVRIVRIVRKSQSTILNNLTQRQTLRKQIRIRGCFVRRTRCADPTPTLSRSAMSASSPCATAGGGGGATRLTCVCLLSVCVPMRSITESWKSLRKIRSERDEHRNVVERRRTRAITGRATAQHAKRIAEQRPCA